MQKRFRFNFFIKLILYICLYVVCTFVLDVRGCTSLYDYVDLRVDLYIRVADSVQPSGWHAGASRMLRLYAGARKMDRRTAYAPGIDRCTPRHRHARTLRVDFVPSSRRVAVRLVRSHWRPPRGDSGVERAHGIDLSEGKPLANDTRRLYVC